MKENKFLPNIAELANKTKNSTSQVCLRVKDSTREFFEEQAKLYSAKAEADDNGDADKKNKTENKSTITANALMTTLLDEYVKSCSENPAQTHFNFHGVRNYLLHQAQIIGKMADDVLISRFFDYWGCDECGEYASAGDMYTDICNKLNGAEIEGYPEFSTCNYWFQYVDKGAKATVEACDPGESDCTNLGIPLEKWALVVAVVHAFLRKVEVGDQSTVVFTPSVMEKLAEAINAHDDRAELAMAVAEVLADYAEQRDV